MFLLFYPPRNTCEMIYIMYNDDMIENTRQSRLYRLTPLDSIDSTLSTLSTWLTDSTTRLTHSSQLEHGEPISTRATPCLLCVSTLSFLSAFYSVQCARCVGLWYSVFAGLANSETHTIQLSITDERLNLNFTVIACWRVYLFVCDRRKLDLWLDYFLLLEH